jgi:hypothetical protein
MSLAQSFTPRFGQTTGVRGLGRSLSSDLPACFVGDGVESPLAAQSKQSSAAYYPAMGRTTLAMQLLAQAVAIAA